MIFCDLNKRLVVAVKKLGVPAYCQDYFARARVTPNAVLMTASNPQFTFGGGIDAAFMREFPELCREKQERPGYNERIGNICFTITVGPHYRATPEMIEKALRFAINQTGKDEELIVNGVGTGIGGLSSDEFVSVLKKVL